MSRIDKHNYYLNIAQQCLRRGTCLRRNYGAVVVNYDEIISTGYTGSPRGAVNCVDRGVCLRDELGIPSGERYELCRSVHAEVNACIHARRRDMLGGWLYLCGEVVSTGELYGDAIPCEMCKRVIVNAGILKVVVRRTESQYDIIDTQTWFVD